MSEKSTLLPTQPVHNVNETTTSQKVAAGLALFCAGTTVGLAWRYVQYTITGGGMNWGSKVWGYHPLLMTLCLLYTSPSPRDKRQSRMPSSA